jgi:nucleotide-binding universal stress UspA family protein
VLTTMAMPPMLRWALGRLPMNKEEEDRLAREEFESRGFVANLERLLVAVDESATGQFVSRLAGALAGPKGMPVTVLPIGAKNAETSPAKSVLVNAAAQTTAAADKADEVDVITREQTAEPEETVSTEAAKGYDFLLIGREPTLGGDGGFDDGIVKIADQFKGPLTVMAAGGLHKRQPLGSPLDILLPVTGTEVSQRGAELAFALARATNSPVTALHVPLGAQSPARRRGFGRRGRSDEAVTRAVRKLAQHYGIELRMVIKRDVAAEAAILRQAERGRHTLIVMGVARRPGEALALGHVADAVLDAADCSVMFLAS